MQLTHYNTKFNTRKFPIVLVCNNVSNASNLGSLLRVADAFGVEKVYFCGQHIELTKKSFRAARATEQVVDHEITNDVTRVVSDLKTKGFNIYSLEITSNSKPIHNIKFQADQLATIVIGDENFGVSDHILSQSDHVMHIEMYGQNSSMNVVQATSIALYEMTKQLL